MNDGKKLEKLVRLIQETIKNVPNTEILPNYKIENQSGRKREIDILIVSFINNMEIKIAIECKDFKNPVPVEKIEAFNSKCQRIRGISKKVFVSTSSYQADSFEAARDFDIELYNLNEISKEQISEWFPIKQLKAIIKLQPPFDIQVVGTKEDIKNIPNEELLIYYHEKRNPILITNFIWNGLVVPEQKKIRSYMLLDFIKGNCRNEKEKRTRIPFSMALTGVYIVGNENKKFDIRKIESEIVAWYDEFPADIIEAKSYEKINTNPEASVLTLNVGNEEITDIVITQNNDFSIFHSTKDGQTYQLKTLASYDPKTDKWESYIENKNEG